MAGSALQHCLSGWDRMAGFWRRRCHTQWGTNGDLCNPSRAYCLLQCSSPYGRSAIWMTRSYIERRAENVTKDKQVPTVAKEITLSSMQKKTFPPSNFNDPHPSDENLLFPSVILFCSKFPSQLFNQHLQKAMVRSDQIEFCFETFLLDNYSMTLNSNWRSAIFHQSTIPVEQDSPRHSLPSRSWLAVSFFDI